MAREEPHHRGQHDEPLGVGGEGARGRPGGEPEARRGPLAKRESEAAEAPHREDDEEREARDEIDPL